MRRRHVTNEIYCGFCHPGEIIWLAMSVYVHVKDAWILEEEVIVEGGDLQTVVEECGHDWVDFIFQEREFPS